MQHVLIMLLLIIVIYVIQKCVYDYSIEFGFPYVSSAGCTCRGVSGVQAGDVYMCRTAG